MEHQKYGTLLTPDIRIHRQYFREMVKLLGIRVLYRAPKNSNSKYTSYAELDTNYHEPILIGCIFDEHPTQRTLKKMGWISELDENSSFIHVDYDLPGLQQGALFIIPSGIDKGKGRLFRVVRMSTSMVYPASITCELVPEYIDNFDTIIDMSPEAIIESEDYNILEDEVLHVETNYVRDDLELEEEWLELGGD